MVIVCWLSADEAEEDGRTGSGRRGGCGSGVARISHEELRGPVGGEGGDAARCSAIALTGATKHSRRSKGFECDVWQVLLARAHARNLAQLSFGELTRLGRLNRSCRRLHDAAWRAIWRERRKSYGSAELGRILQLAVTLEAEQLVRAMARAGRRVGDHASPQRRAVVVPCLEGGASGCG